MARIGQGRPASGDPTERFFEDLAWRGCRIESPDNTVLVRRIASVDSVAGHISSHPVPFDELADA